MPWLHSCTVYLQGVDTSSLPCVLPLERCATAACEQACKQQRGTLCSSTYFFKFSRQAGVLNLTVREGEVVALVGSSGGGKSSIMKLIKRVYEPISG